MGGERDGREEGKGGERRRGKGEGERKREKERERDGKRERLLKENIVDLIIYKES